MSMKWEIPPGVWTLTSLREKYTRAIFVGVSSRMEQYAIDITAWMKEHAPWNDTDVYENGSLRFKAGNARRFLKAELGGRPLNRADKLLIEAKERQANKTEQDMLDNLNATRPGKIPLSKLPADKRVPRPWLPKKEIISTLLIHHGTTRTVPYAVWLEVGMNGRYSIIKPTIDHWGPKIMKGLQAMINLGRFDEKLLSTRYASSTLVRGRGRIRYGNIELEKKRGDDRNRTKRGGRTAGRQSNRRGRPKRTLDYNSLYY